MFVIVKVPADDSSAKCADMKEFLAPRPAGYVPYDMRVNGCEKERLDAIDALNHAVRYAVKHKTEVPFAKEFLNGLYGINSLQFSDYKGDPDPRAIESTGEQCRDAAVSESAEDVRKTTRLDGVDAFTYAIRALFERKDNPGFKNALDGIYGTAHDVASIDLEQMYPKKLENVKADEPNALFVTIETDTFEATPENVVAVNSFISNAGEGRDIHLRII